MEQLPSIYVTEKVSVSADKTRIKQAIKNGENITGARLVINQNLQIK
jgi:hypothetical protein